MSTPEARIIVGAAVIDDVLGLVILSVVAGLAAGAERHGAGCRRGRSSSRSDSWWSRWCWGVSSRPRLFDVIDRMRVRYVLLVAAIAFALGLAALAGLAGSALIIGAFAAGLCLSGTNQFDTIEHEVKPVASVFTPIFFVSVGSSVDLRLLDPTSPAARATLAVAGALIVLAVVGKVAAGWAAPWVSFRRLVVGSRHGPARRGRPDLRRHRPSRRTPRRTRCSARCC